MKDAAEGKEAAEFSHFEISSAAKVALLPTRGGDQSEPLMCYTSRDIAASGWAGAGDTHRGHKCGASDS